MRQKTSLDSEEEKPPPKPDAGLEFLDELRNFERVIAPQQQHLYRGNGHLSLMKNIKMEVVSDIERCQVLWDEFSPKESLFDTWEFRYAFWQGYKHKPHFIVIKNGKGNLALLPLWYERDRKKYFWFGSWWQEDNTFFTKDSLYVPLLLAASPTPLHINAIDVDKVGWLAKVVEFQFDDPKYVLDLSDYSSTDDFLESLKKKKRYNLKRDRRIIEEQGPEIIYDRFSDFDKMVELSMKRFKEKGEDTDWEDPRRVKTFRQVIEMGKQGLSYEARMVTVMIGGKFAAVDLVLIYNNAYYPVKCGYNVAEFPGIGNYMNLFEIEDALSLGMKRMDFLEISYGWKDKWFQSVPLYKLELS